MPPTASECNNAKPWWAAPAAPPVTATCSSLAVWITTSSTVPSAGNRTAYTCDTSPIGIASARMCSYTTPLPTRGASCPATACWPVPVPASQPRWVEKAGATAVASLCPECAVPT